MKSRKFKSIIASILVGMLLLPSVTVRAEEVDVKRQEQVIEIVEESQEEQAIKSEEKLQEESVENVETSEVLGEKYEVEII